MYTVFTKNRTEPHNVQDSVAPQSYIASQSQAFSGSQAWLHEARSYVTATGKRTMATTCHRL